MPTPTLEQIGVALAALQACHPSQEVKRDDLLALLRAADAELAAGREAVAEADASRRLLAALRASMNRFPDKMGWFIDDRAAAFHDTPGTGLRDWLAAHPPEREGE